MADGPGALLGALTTAAASRRFRAGEVLFLEGDISDRLFVLALGAAKIASTSAFGHEVVLGVRRGPGRRRRRGVDGS